MTARSHHGDGGGSRISDTCGASIAPTLVLCSTARRATETLNAILPALEPRPDVRRKNALYVASAKELVRRLRGIPSEVAVRIVIGHNPGIESTALGSPVVANGHARPAPRQDADRCTGDARARR